MNSPPLCISTAPSATIHTLTHAVIQGYILIIVLHNPSYPATPVYPHVRLPSLVAPSHRRAWLQLMNTPDPNMVAGGTD